MLDKERIKARLKGVSVPVITPMLSQGQVDYSGLEKNLDYLIQSGLQEGNGFLLILGTTGEFSSLSREELRAVAKVGVDACKGRVPVVIGSNHSNIREVIEFNNYVGSLGADAVLIRPVYYWGIPTEEMVLNHYNEIEKNTDIGIVIYNRCLTTVVDLPIDTLKKLAEFSKVVALKDGTHQLSKFNKTIKALSGKISCINGWGELYEPYTLLMGSDGFLSVAANFLPRISLKLYTFTKIGNFQEAEKIHLALAPLLDALFSGSYGQFVELAKYGMELRGLSGGPVRTPLPKASEQQKSAIKSSFLKIKDMK
ncbi:MAG: dihydrodipicolinate synthase family protein [Deltaproteobacteria bacterium]|nr:dihydrodipicolinate synthase family protein [Deltaproteobacteria bacterium]